MRRRQVINEGAVHKGTKRYRRHDNYYKNNAYKFINVSKRKIALLLLFTFACSCFLFLHAKIVFIKRRGHSYTICNGLSNQLLGHAGGISKAILSGETVHIPDVFIVNGAQSSDKNVLPTATNTIPLSEIIDVDGLLSFIRSKGVKAQIIPFRKILAEIGSKPQSCDWLETLGTSNHQLAVEVLRNFKPTPLFSKLVQDGISKIPGNRSNGICLHHRNGLDWHEHCKRWESIKDGVWRKNCLNDRKKPLHYLVRNRIPFEEKKSWVFYIGDQNPSPDLINDFKSVDLDIVHRISDKLLLDDDIAEVLNVKEISLDTHRDLFAAVDFFMCAEIESFIGNSVSTFSALQIALRNGMKSSWYNSRSIPLAGSLKVYNIPFVYTYTEASKPISKFLLKVSILSIRNSFSTSTDIHILYHGLNDIQFQKWLRTHNVIIHDHKPTWIDTIEEMRVNGDPMKSHLFLDKGNYIGTWQRIDIPLFIDAEYIMFLDSDTVIHTAFDIHDFGLDVTASIACSAEADEEDTRPWNLGVSLFNVPMLRETYDDFMKFIESHRKNPMFENDNISDQGAYLEYYKATAQFLDTKFNVKPYWNKDSRFVSRKIVHFHGMKPQDILRVLIGFPVDSFPSALHFLYEMILERKPHACLTMRDFGVSISKDLSLLNEYCSTVGRDAQNAEVVTNICKEFFLVLAKSEKESIQSCDELILPIMNKLAMSKE